MILVVDLIDASKGGRLERRGLDCGMWGLNMSGW